MLHDSIVQPLKFALRGIEDRRLMLRIISLLQLGDCVQGIVYFLQTHNKYIIL